MSTLDELNFAYGSISTALFVLIVYHVLLYTVTFTGTFHTQLGANLRNSVNWVLKHKEKSDPASATLAVQTIRNTILVAVFVGGNAFTSAFSFANTYSPDDEVQQARSIILAALLFSSFLCWALVIRFSAHLGYLVGTLSYEPSPSSMQVNVSAPSGSVIEVVTDFPKNQDSKANDIQRGRVEGKRRYDPTKECMRIVGLCMTFFSLGFRFLFMALPFAFLSMGGLGLIISTFVMILFLSFFDYGFHFIDFPMMTDQ